MQGGWPLREILVILPASADVTYGIIAYRLHRAKPLRATTAAI